MADDEPVDRTDEETDGPEFDDENGNSSGEEFEVERTATRGEVAALLHDLADGVASGSVAFDDGALVVGLPEALDLEVAYERDDDETEIEVELEWPTAEAIDADHATGTESDDDSGEASEGEDSTGSVEEEDVGVEAGETDAENLGAVIESDGGLTADADETGDGSGFGLESGIDSDGTVEVASGATTEPGAESTDAPESEVVGLVEPSEVARSRARFELYRDRADKWRWRLVHHNGNIIADGGGGYTRKANARKGLESVKRNAPGALVREKE
jgi:amphi-Trp domain-containing protein